jgi:parallel beta-helix repeat protein
VAADLSVNGDCIKIQSGQVILDCAGHSIRGVDSIGGYGIAILKFGFLGLAIPSDIEIRNCRISNFRYGIFVEGSRQLTIRDNVCSGNYDDTGSLEDREGNSVRDRFGIFLGMVEGGGIRLNETTDALLLNNTTNRQAIGIDVRNSTNVVVRGNTASDNSAWGVHFLDTRDSEISNNTTADNIRVCPWGNRVVVKGCDAAGIMLQGGSSNNRIKNNLVTGENGNGIFLKTAPGAGDNLIASNIIEGAVYNAVELVFCKGNTLRDNSIRGSLDGIWLGFARDIEIVNNSIVDTNNHGIISENSHHVVVSGNDIVGSNIGLFFYTTDFDRNLFGFLPPGDYSSHDNCICGNTFRHNAWTDIELRGSTNNQVANNTFLGIIPRVRVDGAAQENNLQTGASQYCIRKCEPTGHQRLPFE